MSCVIGLIEENGRIWMGGDSADSAGTFISSRGGDKIFKLTDESGSVWLVGCTGMPRISQIIQYKLELHPKSKISNTDDMMNYVVTEFIPQLRQALHEESSLIDEGGVAKLNSSTVLLGVHGHFVEIDAEFNVLHCHEGYVAIGTGSSLAYGSLFTTHQLREKVSLNPHERIMRALEAAEEWTTNVRRPFTIMNNVDSSFPTP